MMARLGDYDEYKEDGTKIPREMVGGKKGLAKVGGGIETRGKFTCQVHPKHGMDGPKNLLVERPDDSELILMVGRNKIESPSTLPL